MDIGDPESAYVDVDGTLLLWPGQHPGRIPRLGEPHYGEPPTINKPLVDALMAWHKPGRTLVIWSWGGKPASERAAKLCGLKPDACLMKPHSVIDDVPLNVAPGNGRVKALKVRYTNMTEEKYFA